MTSFRPSMISEEQFLTVLPIFFENYSIIVQVINIILISWHVSKEISKKNSRWVELKGKIWSISTTNKALLTDLASPRENRMMNIKNFHGAVQSDNAIFAGFKHVKVWQGFFHESVYLNGSKYTSVWYLKEICKKFLYLDC